MHQIANVADNEKRAASPRSLQPFTLKEFMEDILLKAPISNLVL